MNTPARYFPVTSTPLRMRPGLKPFPADLGNGDSDRLFFQLDSEYERYMRAKRVPARPSAAAPWRRHRVARESAQRDAAHAEVLSWIRETLGREHPRHLEALSRTTERYGSAYDEFARNLQEDLVVLQKSGDGRDAATMVHVCFPSGWRPEQVVETSFQEIHGPVPDFAKSEAAVESMLDAILERGPYLRFVWTVSADDVLDHHPEEGIRQPWHEQRGHGWLRVERQITVPFPKRSAMLFIIRTYLYPFESLRPEERSTLRTALERMPEAIRNYKGIDRPAALAALGRSEAGPLREG